MEFASSDYKVLGSAGLANITLALSGQVISRSFNVTVITTDCASPTAPATGYHGSISHYLIVCNPVHKTQCAVVLLKCNLDRVIMQILSS